MVQLRDYQMRSLDELHALSSYGHSRATLVLPCGTGKTVVATQMIPTGPKARTVLFVPTIALLHQTWLAIARAHPSTAMLGVCGPSRTEPNGPDDMTAPEAAALLDGPLTTDPDTIATHLTTVTGPLIIVATYASSPAVEAAATQAAIAFDLLICDEAHRTAGDADKAWATPVHAIAASRRLFMTATPRSITVTENSALDLDDADVVTMSSLADYGPHIAPITFREAIDAGHLADYQVAIVGVNARTTWDQLAVSATSTAHRASDAGMQLALLNAATTHDLRSCLVFHNRIADSKRWTEELQQMADALNIPLYAAHIDGSTPANERHTILKQLANPGDRLSIVSNCRVFAEGIDVPELDAVMFAAPRTAAPDIIQIVGRAIRPHPHRRHQKALVILPVFDHTDDLTDLETKAARTSHLAAWQVLTALAEQDELLYESLTQWRDHTEAGAPRPPTAGPVRVDTDTLSAAGAAFVLKTIARASSPHLLTAARLRAFHARYGHTRVAPGTVIDDYPLAARLAAARASYRASRMHPRVAAQFDAIPGFAWTLRTPGTRRTPPEWIALVGEYITSTGVHTITRDAWVTDPVTKARANIGRWVHVDAAKRGFLTPSEQEALAATGYRRP
ncbi:MULTISPECIES: DEAD/DEAH box helicase family protein [Mycolicibacter]|uniref:DEAD/DEAH box helicase family protein n=2 Tax=Mycolicibacter TaxID=1073531 RepID=A0ABU5XMG6_9MYCO|nr:MULTISPECIES: DEAD/DEAH box helicase family protein [unclassified Mycolicibacter]MEB3023401.1 DEAD/DEAH box helicase family protein [Mycolicibacter sp. MYC098]MEB3033743.1 DEAD/DEAH box helicase family protein [Mycolicibacter sp. MYC340]